MGTPSVSDESSGIFSDAINISPGHYNSSNYSNPPLLGQYNSQSAQELGMLVGDGIVLSPNEAMIFKKIQKIVAENKSLKNALVVNSGRLQTHVNDCIQWKEKTKAKEDQLKEQLNTEKQKVTQLQMRLDFLNTAMSTSSMAINSSSLPSSIELFITELNQQSRMLSDVMNASNQAHQSSEEKPLIKEAYEASIGAIKQFVIGRKFETLDDTLSSVQNFCIPLNSHDGKILRDAITSIQNSSKDYQRAVNSVENGHQVPLIQHVELKNQFEIMMEENQKLKNQLKTYIEQSSENEKLIAALTNERDEMQIDLISKSTAIEKLMEELENCRSVEILDLTPHQQPREIKQLEANIESYKNTIHSLKERNESLDNELTDANSAFEKVDEENSDLRDQVDLLKKEIERLNDILCGQPVSHHMQDVDASASQQKLMLQQYAIKVSKLESANKTLATELNTLRDKQLVTYELPDDMQEKVNELEKNVQQSKEELKLKDEALKKYKDESEDLQKIMSQLSIKDEKIVEATGMLDSARCECKGMEEKLKNQKKEFEMKNRVQKNRESKDADRINNLKKSNEELKKENENMKTEIEKLREHIESINSVIQQENLTKEKTFATLLDRSEEIMSIDYKSMVDEVISLDTSNDEVTLLVNENTQLTEELEKLRVQFTSLEEESGKEKRVLEFLTQADENNAQRYDKLQKECQSLHENLLSEAQQNTELREELQRIQLHLQGSNTGKKELVEMQEQCVATQRAHEKLRRDYQQLYDKLQAKVKNIKDSEEKINELTTEIVGAKELIGELKDKERISNEMINALQDNERRANMDKTKLQGEVEEVGVLRMQLDVYKNDFEAERESREKQQTELIELREVVDGLRLENHRLKEELNKRGLNTIRQRHGSQTYYGNNPHQSIDPRQQQGYGNQQNYGRDIRPQGAGVDERWQQQPSVNDYQVYGRGNEQIDSRRPAQRQSNNRMDEDEQRKCPKCQEVLPDLDSLQIHVMECLDKP